MDTMNQLENMRMSFAEQDYDTGIKKVISWINIEGMALLKVNQRLPISYEEALETRKEHEKMELKCTKFLAFFSQMSLKEIPIEYDELKKSMDSEIQMFSDKIKARRHVVVAFCTYFRHLDWLEKKSTEYISLDMKNLPEDYDGIKKLIEQYQKNTDTLSRKMCHLKIEKDRILTAIEIMLNLEASETKKYIDKSGIEKIKNHLDQSLTDIERTVTTVYENNRLLESEFKIELRVLTIEKDMKLADEWLDKLQKSMENRYNTDLVARGTMDNLELQRKTNEFREKHDQIHEYGKNLLELYKKLTGKMERDNSDGVKLGRSIDTKWNEGNELLDEYEDRLQNTYRLFLGLDETLTKLEDILLNLNRDKVEEVPTETIKEKYEPMRQEIHEDFEELKQLSKHVNKQLHGDLLGNKLKPESSVQMEVDQTQATIRMRIFTLAIKLKEFDQHLGDQNDSGSNIKPTDYAEPNLKYLDNSIPISFSKSSSLRKPSEKNVSDSDKITPATAAYLLASSPGPDDMEKYIEFLNVTQRNWESKPPPTSTDQAVRMIHEHEKLKPQSDAYFHDILKQYSPQQSSSDKKHEIDAGKKRKQAWEKDWASHLHDELNPRHDWLKKADNMNNWLDEKIEAVDQLSDRPNDTVELAREINKDLNDIEKIVPEKRKELDTLNAESKHLFNGDMDRIGYRLNKKMESFEDQLSDSRELEKMVFDIEKLIPQIRRHKGDWNNSTKSNRSPSYDLQKERESIKKHINTHFDVDRLRHLARVRYGNTKKIEWLIDELDLDNYTSPAHKIHSKQEADELMIIPQDVQRERGKFNFIDGIDNEVDDKISVSEHGTTMILVDIPNKELARVEGDQYNLQWYKDDKMIDLEDRKRVGKRMKGDVDIKKGKAMLEIDDVRMEDKGNYKVQVIPSDHSMRVENLTDSKSVLLNVHHSRPQRIKKATFESLPKPKLPDIVYAPIKEALVINTQISVDDTEPSDIRLMHNGKPVNKMATGNLWRQTSNEAGEIEFMNPSITKRDAGIYQLMFDGDELARTQVKVGEPPILMQSQFKKSVRLGEDVAIVIPVANTHHSHNHPKDAHSSRQVIWSKDGREIAADKYGNQDKYMMYEDGNCNPVLEIKKFNTGMEGLYSCEVSNEFGTRHAEVSLELREGSVSSPGGHAHATYSRHAPRGSIDAVSVSVGDRITLPFEFDDDDSSMKHYKPDVEWTKDNQLIGNKNPRYRISYPNRSSCVLQIERANANDSGIYTAVENHTNARKTTRVEIMPKGCRPTIENYPRKVQVKQDDRADILVVLRSIPFSNTIEWSFKPTNDPSGPPKPISANNSKYQFQNRPIIESQGHLQEISLSINSVQSEDVGEYIVKCGNSIGWTSMRIPLVITGEAQNKKSPPRFSHRLQSEFLTPKDRTVHLICKAVGNPTPVVTWKLNGSVIGNHPGKIQISKSVDKHELTIYNVDESDVGRYHALAKNNLGLDDCFCDVRISDEEFIMPAYNTNEQSQFGNPDSALSPMIMSDCDEVAVATPSGDHGNSKDGQRTQLVFSNTVVRSPPQFVSTFADEVVSEGSQLVLRCCIIGQPEPVVWWSYNTHFLRDNPRIHIAREHDEYLLIMNDLNPVDSGRYSITAENSSGLATCSALVVVEKAKSNHKNQPHHNNTANLVDRSKYPTRSKPLEGGQFPCHTTLSHTMSPGGTLKPNQIEESKLMHVGTGQGHIGANSDSLPHNQSGYNTQLTQHNYDENDDANFSELYESDVDIQSLRTKTVRTYHYTGPSGVELPGVGFIPGPRVNTNNHRNTKDDDYDDDDDDNSTLGGYDDDDDDERFNKNIKHAKYVPRVDVTHNANSNVERRRHQYANDPNSMSCVESSDGDCAL